MKFVLYSFKMVLGVMVLLCSCSSGPTIEPDEQVTQTERIIKFSGYEWIVRTSNDGKLGPGPNFFSDSEDNVWVDEDGRLHLKIVQKGGLWYCSGVILRQSLGYGKYVFYLSSDVSKLDQHVVGGLFTYLNDEEEIDIEFSKWSDQENQDSQFAVQPADLPGNKERYDLDLLTAFSTHSFNWQPDRVDFFSRQGHGLIVDDSNRIHEWTYRGSNIPPSRGTERLRLNLWLFRGRVPSDATEQEMIIEKIEYFE
ncbi:glycoside hydrolase family 16 protein [Olivibacter sitiensis]|uniref:glycoside hydrolase family 16 protein n=1 Tax=Olivibacter sitiensis TaxID=376470 RepID=UPI000400FF55|nr:glycoside hydrolase family 16 protein [Olivibacter sitiensis]